MILVDFEGASQSRARCQLQLSHRIAGRFRKDIKSPGAESGWFGDTGDRVIDDTETINPKDTSASRATTEQDIIYAAQRNIREKGTAPAKRRLLTWRQHVHPFHDYEAAREVGEAR